MVARENLSIRAYQPGDLSALVALANTIYAAIGDERRVTLDELRMNLEAPDFDAPHNAFVAEREGRMVGFSDLDFSAATGRGWSNCLIHPDEWEGEIGGQMIRLSEARCLERAQTEIAPDQPVSIIRQAVERHWSARRLYEAEGYQRVRTIYQMRMELDQPVDVPPLPEGIALRPFDLAAHAQAVYEAFEEAFSDHWGFERDSYEDWAHFVIHNPKTDFSLWLLAFDGDEIAGFCLNRRFGDEDPEMGWVWELGVRRAWRKRGLGTALLKRSLALLQQRGYRRAGLGVDSESLTNAVALYERAGMHVHTSSLIYRKLLRGADA